MRYQVSSCNTNTSQYAKMMAVLVMGDKNIKVHVIGIGVYAR